MNALMGGKHGSGGGGGGGSNSLGGLASQFLNSGSHGGSSGGGGGGGSSSSSNPLGGLANQFLGGGSQGSGGGGGGKNSSAGKLVGQLASNMFSSSGKPDPPQNYHGGSTAGQPSHSGGLAGSVMGGVANMFGGKPGGSNVRSSVVPTIDMALTMILAGAKLRLLQLWLERRLLWPSSDLSTSQLIGRLGAPFLRTSTIIPVSVFRWSAPW